MKLFESRTDKLLAITISAFISCFGIISIFLEGYFLGFWCLGIGVVGLFYSTRRLGSNPVIIEFKDDGVLMPYKGKTRFFNYNEIIRVEKIRSVLADDSSGNVIELYLKNERKPLRVSFPVIDNIDDNKLIRMIRERINYTRADYNDDLQ